MTELDYTENLFISSHAYNKKLGWAVVNANDDFCCGKHDGEELQRGLVKALLEAVRHANPMLRNEIFTNYQPMTTWFDKLKFEGQNMMVPSLKNMDHWMAINDLVKNRKDYVFVKYIIDGTDENMTRAQRMAIKASGVR